VKTRPTPGRTRLAQAAALAVRDNRVSHAIDARVQWLKSKGDTPEPRLWEFNDDEQYAIFALAHKEAESG